MDNSICPFLDLLPLELRVKIYKFLPVPDILSFRLANHQINNEIQSYYPNFGLRIEQSSYPQFWRILYKFTKLGTITVQNFVRSVPSPNARHFQKFPKSVSKLMLDGMLSLPNLFWLLENLAPTLEQFIITHETLGLENLLSEKRVQTLVENEFKKLKYLSLQYLRYPDPDPYPNTDEKATKNIEYFLTANFPCLESFKLYYSLWGNWADLVGFLNRHGPGLKNLELQVGDRSDRLPTLRTIVSLNPKNLPSPQNLQDLKVLKFRDDILNMCARGKRWILELVKSQKSLEIFHFHSPGDIGLETLEQILQNNSQTLNEFVLFSMGTAPRLDISLFSNCTKLTVLSLSITQTQNLPLPVITQIFNLSRLPPTIQKLHLSGFKIDAEELVLFSRSQAASSLQLLELIDLGRISFSLVVRGLIGNCPKLEHLNIRPLALENSENEVEVLDAFYQRFMGQFFDPIDDLDGFEAKIEGDKDRVWAQELNL